MTEHVAAPTRPKLEIRYQESGTEIKKAVRLDLKISDVLPNERRIIPYSSICARIKNRLILNNKVLSKYLSVNNKVMKSSAINWNKKKVPIPTNESLTNI
tara:strand:- start:140 stop:439 length:300 start_codon:yes stop_codon:yes gene_type:complete